MDAEGRREGGVSGVAAMGHENAANARDIVARVKGVPLPVQVGLKPGAEIHGESHRCHTNIAEIAGAVAGGDVHAATQGDGQMGKIATDAGALAQRLQGCATGACAHIVKSSMLVDKIADGLHTWPARLCLVEQRAREIFQGAVHFAITARQQEKQAIVR